MTDWPGALAGGTAGGQTWLPRYHAVKADPGIRIGDAPEACEWQLSKTDRRHLALGHRDHHRLEPHPGTPAPT